ncbi:MAG: sigma-54 dependent transcriptional regulator [Polyangiaceae bacterium]
MSEILIAGDTGDIAAGVRRGLEARGHDTTLVESGRACLDRYQEVPSDAVVVCLPLADMGGGTLLRSLKGQDRAANIIVSGSDREIPDGVAAYEFGALEYVADPVSKSIDLLAAVGMAVGSRRGDVQLRYLRERQAAEASANTLVAECSAMQDAMRVVRMICARASGTGTAPTILITGETGTGKGQLAKYIHYNGGRRTRPFVEINCAAIPGQLLEAELFGHERGAFTDARTRRAGLFETAHEGTLFLDEIGAVPIDLQAKLLTAIEEKRLRRIGGRESITVDTQILAATHADLKTAAKNGHFRVDLYHRLNVISVRLPPLRERGNDKIILAERFVASTCREYGLPPRRLTPRARAHIMEYPWPGNVRELRNQLERIVLLHDDDVVDVDHFEVSNSLRPPDSDRFSVHLPEGGVSLADIEREVIERALDRFEGNVSQTARYLRISRQTLIYRMKKHDLRRTADDDD